MRTTLLAILVACLVAVTAEARRTWPTPSLATTCPVCDSTERVDWGDGTYRHVLEVSGAGYQAGQAVRLTWSDQSGDLWSFDIQAAPDGTFSTLWTDVPVGAYRVTASQPRNRNRWVAVAEVEVVVL